MIKIIREGDIITFKGHTRPDICASVSSIMYTTVNALEKYCALSVGFLYEDNLDADFVRIKIIKHDEIIDMLVGNMFDMLNDLYDDGNEDKLEIVVKK